MFIIPPLHSLYFFDVILILVEGCMQVVCAVSSSEDCQNSGVFGGVGVGHIHYLQCKFETSVALVSTQL